MRILSLRKRGNMPEFSFGRQVTTNSPRLAHPHRPLSPLRSAQRGPVRGISLKLQEEERERRFDIVPEISYPDEQVKNGLSIDDQTVAMLKTIGFAKLPNTKSYTVHATQAKGRGQRRQ